jgi:hypothetical protein
MVLMAAGLVFTYVYGFYKSVGADARIALISRAARTGLAVDYHRSVGDVLLGDLSRASVHAMLWERLDNRQVAGLGWGKTYLAAATLWVPAGVLWDRPPSKSVIGAAIEDDVTIASARALPNSRQYGISGEAALNIGIVGFAVGAMVFVLLVGALQRWERAAVARRSPATMLTVRLLATLLLSVMLSDMDNWVVLAVKVTPVLLVIQFAVSERRGRHVPQIAVPGGVRARA